MKKTLHIIILLLISNFSFAQVRFGVKGSLQSTNEKISASSYRLSPNSLLGFQSGILIDAPLGKKISLRPQVLYSVKGSKSDLSSLLGGLGGNITGDATTMLRYLEIPVQVMYGFDARNGRFVLGAGPYLAYTLNSKVKINYSGSAQAEPAVFGWDENQIKRFDFGLHLSAGYELTSGLMVSSYYSPGLANIINIPNTAFKNTAFGVSLGYLFGGE